MIIQTIVYLIHWSPYIPPLLTYLVHSDLHLRATKVICSESLPKYILAALPGLQSRVIMGLAGLLTQWGGGIKRKTALRKTDTFGEKEAHMTKCTPRSQLTLLSFLEQSFYWIDKEGMRFINRLSNSTFPALQFNYHELTLKTALTFQHIQCAQEKQHT